ncbi:MAG: hypothetical protein CSA24_00695 [Deltaproteobacteria bacterium]|nr:MAG: hypothetical protein CSB49_07845 [Pseudomonadota bacterium]PIE66262.1 MAG: hypothetical protein CSA24_00695 [Deltaproteobacteria bacterium]
MTAPPRHHLLPVSLTLALSLATSLLLSLATSTAAEARTRLPKLTTKQLDALEKGRVLVQMLPAPKGSKVGVGEALGIAEGSSDALVHMLLDIASYQHYMLRIKTSRLIKQVGKVRYGLIETRLPWPLRDGWIAFKLTFNHLGKGVYELRWAMSSGTFKRYRGFARIEPWDEQNDKVAITYRVHAETKTYAPAALLNRAMKRNAEMFLHRVRLRIKALKRAGTIPGDVARRYR